MKRDIYISIVVNKDESTEINNYIKMNSDSWQKGPILRQLILDTIRSKNPIDNKQDDAKQEDLPITPSDTTNPYADLDF